MVSKPLKIKMLCVVTIIELNHKIHAFPGKRSPIYLSTGCIIPILKQNKYEHVCDDDDVYRNRRNNTIYTVVVLLK